MAYRGREPYSSGRGYRHSYGDAHESMYDDREPPRYRGSSPQRHSPPYDKSRTPPRAEYERSEYYDNRRGRDSGRDEYYSRGQPPSDNRGGYRDRDREGYRSPRYDSRSRSRSRSPRRSRSPNFGGPPSREVMMDGLPMDMTEEDPTADSAKAGQQISRELKRYLNVDEIEDIRVIRERQTKQSRGFGFLRFGSSDLAKAFLQQNHPTISLYGSSSTQSDDQAIKVRVTYSREREDKGRAKIDVEWMCPNCSFTNFAGRKICYKCQTPYSQSNMYSANPPQPEFSNSGDSDASPHGDPSQFLLFRSLEPTVTEELLAKGVAKLYKPNAGSAQNTASSSKKGNAKVASTTGDANLGAKEGSIRRILLVRDRRTNESWRYGFAEFASVDDALAALIRYNSFERFTIASKPVTVSYIHAGVFVPVFDPAAESEECMFVASANPAIRLRYWDEGAYVKELIINQPEEPTVSSADAARTATDAAAAAAEKEGLISQEEADAKSKKRKTESKDASKQKKVTPAHLQFWSNRHAELHGSQKAQQPQSDTETGEESSASVNVSDKPVSQKQSYSDPKKLCCYLCSRQFKSQAEVNKHERLSQLHRDNLANEDLRNKAISKLEKSGIEVQPLEDAGPEYRDRAKERRAAFGSSKKVSLPLKKTQSPQKEPSPPPAQTQSKGASLLGKMGWSAGEGLGAKGTGMTAPIETNLYAAGVGLGAQGGKMGDAVEEADRNTKGNYADFVERAKDKAKERYEKMA